MKILGIIRVAGGESGQELFAITDPDYRALVGSAIAIGDIDNDGLPEIVGYNRQNKAAMAFEHDGTPKWLSSEPTCAAIPAIADLEGDGSPEIVMGNVVYNNDGSKKWSVSDEVCSVYHYMMPCVANLDLKTGNEVIMGHKAFLADGTLLWEAEGMWPGYARTCAIANFDDDPFPEVVFVGAGWITLFEHDGTSKWGTPFAIQSGGRGGAPSVADCDGDGEPEIVAAGASRLVVVNADRTLLWEAPIKDSSSNMTSCTVFDFEGDGEAEVVYQDEDYLRVYKGANGEVLFQEELHTGTLVEMPIVVDIDGDNNAEIVAVENTILFGGDSAGLHVFGDANDTWVNTRKIWNQHTYHITNVNDDGSIPRYEANNWHTFNNYRQNQMFNPLGCTDLSASYARIESTGEPPVLRIAARIGNSGALGVPAGVNVAFYEGDPDAGGLLLGVRQTDVSLDPGQYLEMTLDYVKNRYQFGRPIASFQAVQHHCANMKIDVDGARLITYQAAWRLGQDLPCRKQIGVAKAFTSEAYRRVTALGHQIHGGIGFTTDHDMQLYFRRAKAAELAYGDAAFYYSIIAQEIGL